MRDNLSINEDTIFQIPLIVPMARSYFKKIDNKENEIYYRALDLRLCLEKICDQYIYEFISVEDKKKWNTNTTLNDKLNITKKYINRKIVNNLIDAKNIGNRGAHDGNESEITEYQLEKSKKAIFNFSLEVFVFYFKKYGFTDPNGSWIPYIFSTLPPLYRIKVLEKYFKINKELIVIRKLALAYTKNNDYKKMKKFLDKCLSDKNINKEEFDDLIEDMDLINTNLYRFPIAKNMKEAKENFISACDKIAKHEDISKQPFILLMSLIFYGSKEDIITEKDKASQITREIRNIFIVKHKNSN